MEGIRKDGVLVSARKILNFIQGNGMTITIADSGSGPNVIDITLAATGGAGGAPSGAAGGDLSGTYPNPDVKDDSHAHAVTTAPGTTDHSALSNVFADQHHTESHTMTQHSAAASVDIGNVGASADGGVSAKTPRADHIHAHGNLAGSVAGAHAHGDLSSVGATDHHAAPAAGPDADTTIDTAGAAGTAATFARSGHGHKVGTYASAAAAIGTAAAGTSGTAPSRGDHVHATGAGTPSTQAIGDAAATGTGPAASMTDHKHAMPAFGTGPAAVGTQANGASASIARIDHVHATGAGTPSTQAMGDAAATGTGPAASMTDHKHAMPALGTTTVAVGTAAGGSAVTPSKSDHVHATGAGTPSTQAFGDAAAVGTGPAASMTDHKHAMPANPVSLAAPALTLGTANAAGVASTLFRTDATILAFDATGPSTSAVGDAAAVGTATVAARRDHVHGREAFGSSSLAVGTSSAGSATTEARSDHIHATGAGTPSTQAFGDAAATGTGPAASMTDHKHAMPAATVTRTVFIGTQDMIVDSGVSTAHGTAPDIIQSILLADAATQGAYFHTVVPNDWSSGAITYTIYWAPGSTDASSHTVRWSADVLLMVTGTTSAVAAGTTTAFTGTSAARTVALLYTEPAQTLTTPASAGQLIRVDLRRVGADVADTYVGAVRLHGVLLSYTATR